MKIYKLITEANCPNFEAIKDVIIKEEKQADGSVKKVTEIAGPFIQTDTKNRNGRIYPHKLMERSVEKYIADRMSGPKFRSFSELGHPDSLEINLHRVSHIITELHWQGKNVMGKAKLVDTEYGRIAESLIAADGQLGMSSRGVGALNTPNEQMPGLYEDSKLQHGADANIVTEFELVAHDLVADPSGLNCFVNGILESKQYIMVGGKFTEQSLERSDKAYNLLEKSLVSLPNRERDDYILKQIQRFLNNI